MEIVAIDIGGTHARFALAELNDGRVTLAATKVLRTGEYDGLADAWRAYAASLSRPLPAAAGIAVAGPIDADAIMTTNNDWTVRPAALAAELNIDKFTVINDFAAVAHAISMYDEASLRHVCGPDKALPTHGVVTVVGPGTGLGVAILDRLEGRDRVVATEGGHIEFAPLDDVEQAIRDRLRVRFGRVSVERMLCGAGLGAIYGGEPTDDKTLWTAALSGTDPDVAAALDRYCMILGSVAGDLALAHGASAVVIAGGLGLRLAGHLPNSSFAKRFVAKGRFSDRMALIPVKLITDPQPGLLGAAVAFAAQHRA